MSTETIEHAVLKQLSDTGMIKSVTAVADGDSWRLVFTVGNTSKVLKARNSQSIRAFRKLETLSRYLKEEFNINHYEVDQTNYDPSQKSLSRPERSKRLKEIHQAADYDKWFRSQVQEAVDEVNTGVNKLYSTEEVKDSTRAAMEKARRKNQV